MALFARLIISSKLLRNSVLKLLEHEPSMMPEAFAVPFSVIFT
jgi:hypothetical protein